MMPAPTGKDYVTQGTPKVGRVRLDSGDFTSLADIQYTRSLLDPVSVVLRKQGYFYQHTRLNLAQNNTYVYRLKAPADKHVAVLVREVQGGQGPFEFETVINPTVTSPGTLVTPTNLYTGGPPCGCELEQGVTITGGTVIPADYIFGAGNKTATASGGGNLPTILPPGVEIFARVINRATGSNPGIRFALAFAELVLPDALVIS